MNVHFEKDLIFHEILIGPRCVMVPAGVFKIKTTSRNNQGRNIHR